MEATLKTALSAPYNVGDEIKDFSLPLLDGSKVRFSDYRGKTIVLVFTATWCPYCGAEAPFLEKEVWQKYRERGVQVLVIDVKESAEIIGKFRDRYGWTFPVVVDESGEVALQFAPRKEGLPPEVAIINAHFIVDSKGKVRYREYLNMERFDARARTVAEELEKVLEK